jgi:hypothetical protein
MYAITITGISGTIAQTGTIFLSPCNSPVRDAASAVDFIFDFLNDDADSTLLPAIRLCHCSLEHPALISVVYCCRNFLKSQVLSKFDSAAGWPV